jgi:uncharacterized membrane protein
VRPDPANPLIFLGHFHPLLVHLPIGALVLLGLLELLARFTRWKNAAQNSGWIMGFVCGTVIVSAVCGWMLAHAGGYDSQLLQWHEMAGFSLAGVCLVTFLLRHLRRPHLYHVSLFAALVLLVIASHLGGSITHGRDFLTRYAPAPLRALLERSMVVETITRPPPSSLQQTVFAGVIKPILQQRCSACHGAEKHKAELRLDSLQGLLRGGQDGPVIKAGRAKDSSLIQSLLSPLDADGHMPPEDHPQPTVEEIALLEWWINEGAPATEKIADFRPKPEIQRLLEIVSRRLEQVK